MPSYIYLLTKLSISVSFSFVGLLCRQCLEASALLVSLLGAMEGHEVAQFNAAWLLARGGSAATSIPSSQAKQAKQHQEIAALFVAHGGNVGIGGSGGGGGGGGGKMNIALVKQSIAIELLHQISWQAPHNAPAAALEGDLHMVAGDPPRCCIIYTPTITHYNRTRCNHNHKYCILPIINHYHS